MTESIIAENANTHILHNDAHITHQDIDDLRKLVKANSTNNATNGSNTIVMISRKTGYAVLFCVYPHGAKL